MFNDTNLDLVPHRPLSSDHDLAACVFLKLLRRHSPGTKYPTHEVELQEEIKPRRNLGQLIMSYN